MHKILGIDLGASAVKAVAIEANFRTHELRAYRAEPVAPNVEGEEPKSYAERVAASLQAFAQDDWFRADTIVAALPAAQVATHLISLPFTDRKQVDATLPGEIEALIPFDLDEVVYDAHVVSKQPGKTELLVTVARKDDVQGLLDLLRDVGVDPNIVTFSALSYASLLADGYLPAPQPIEGVAAPIEAVVDIGHERTSILLTEAGQVRFARTTSVAGIDVTRAVARVMGTPLAQAEQTKRTLSLNGQGDPTLQMAIERAASTLLRELRATISSYSARTKGKVERIHLCGGGARLDGLAQFLSDALGLPVELLQLSNGKQFPDEGQLEEGALALALAVRGLNNAKAPKVNFRKGQFAFTQTEGEMRGRYGLLAAMAAVLVLLFGFSTWAKLSALEKREQKIDDALCDTTKKILGKCETDFKVALGRLKGKGSPAAAVPQVSAVELAHTVSLLFPPGDEAILNDLDIVDNTVRLRGDAKGYETVDNVVSGLQANKCFSDVKKGKLSKRSDNRVDFDLDAVYSCGQPATKKAGS